MSSSLTRLRPYQTPFFRNFRSFSSSSQLSSRLRQPGEPTGPNEPPTHISSSPSKSPLKVWPIILIFATGSFLFKKIVDQRKGEGYQPKGPVQGHSPSGKGTVQPSHPH
ncbi:uncharacterized protein K460DRAFT_430863 [Cucurbitaria berberidis CBS 394.84]|uniref:Uncharacterized protein n=1 Tax=Cucurbitaria berberidis CBS 394.84 TaxID=1168544 RepID=A0A9P4GHX9_9PLEO|nr:uncharacterized protein K460DRAFT_430863 [Cucurbitaria berberidis CBS 394.84]KAF1845910.1 hypothetical protein K460DRAFT_430863 [Cucurbitaria berberidis CBS 394.84]